MKFNTLNPTYGNIRKSFCCRPCDLRKFTKFVCYRAARASYERCNHGCWSAAAWCTERRPHSMTLAAPSPVELAAPSEAHRGPQNDDRTCQMHPKILATVSCTLRPWLHPAGVSFSWSGQLSRAGNKHSSAQCVKVMFNFLL